MAMDSLVSSFALSFLAAVCRGKDFTERNLHHARHPWSARAHHHALHSCHGVAVSRTQAYTRAAHLFKSSVMKTHLVFLLIVCSVNKEKTCYTGALCGLGCNTQAQEGVLPGHDIELTFDVKFDVEDIIEVTHSRVCV